MSSLFVALFALVTSSFRTRVALQAEILALRHQLAVFQKNAPRRLRLQRSDRLLWVLLSRWWPGWRRSLHIVRPDTVIAWQAVGSLLNGSLDQFLRQRVSACRQDFRVSSSDGVFGNHTYTRHPWLPECSKTRACCDVQVTVGKDSQSEIFIAAHFPNLAVSLPQYQFAATGWLSKIGFQVNPASIDFQMPPPAPPK